MKLVSLAKIIRPHGYRGAFVAETSAGSDSNLAHLEEVFVGSSEESAVTHRILEASWMPKGWKIVLEGISSDTEVNAIRGQNLYAVRDKLQEPDSNEYYVSDLMGAKVIDSETGNHLGHLDRVESDGQDRWWIRLDSGAERPVPANGHFIAQVDTEKKIVYLKNLSELP
jgi:16S rRNA processing protein RimM